MIKPQEQYLANLVESCYPDNAVLFLSAVVCTLASDYQMGILITELEIDAINQLTEGKANDTTGNI